MTRYPAGVLLVCACSPVLSHAHSMEQLNVCATELVQVEAQVRAVSERYQKQQRTIFKRRSAVAHTEKHMDRWIDLLKQSQQSEECSLQQRARLMQFQFDLERLLKRI